MNLRRIQNVGKGRLQVFGSTYEFELADPKCRIGCGIELAFQALGVNIVLNRKWSQQTTFSQGGDIVFALVIPQKRKSI